jgi:hypothetical protein
MEIVRRQQVPRFNWGRLGLVTSRHSLDLVLILRRGHYGVVLDLCKLLLFPVGVHEFMTGGVTGIEPGHYGFRLHRPSVREGDGSVVCWIRTLSIIG